MAFRENMSNKNIIKFTERISDRLFSEKGISNIVNTHAGTNLG